MTMFFGVTERLIPDHPVLSEERAGRAGQRAGAARLRAALIPTYWNVGQESVVCSHALRGGDWVWLA